MRLGALVQERGDGGGKGGAERPRLELADVGIREATEGLGGKVVVAARLDGGQVLAKAGERERVVAHRANVVLGLPETPTLDAGARVERVDHAPTRGGPSRPAVWDTRARPPRRTAAGTAARRDEIAPPASARG